MNRQNFSGWVPIGEEYFFLKNCLSSFVISNNSNFSEKNTIHIKGCQALLCHTFCKTIGALVPYVVLLLFVAQSGMANANNNAERQAVYQLNLPQQSVAQSLSDLSEQANQMLLFSYEEVESVMANPVVGRYTLQQALRVMLQGTGFSGSLTEKGVLMVSVTKHETLNNQTEGIESMNSKKKLLASIISMFMGSGGSSLVYSQEAAGNSQDDLSWALEEIVVTASRRESGLNDTAISVAAISGEDIARRNLEEMNDYLRTVPGANFVSLELGQNAVVMRGIGVNPQQEALVSSATAGIYFGEVSITGTTFQGGSADIRMIDLERVEVLRGPQGTLFGSGALSGAVRNIPNAPSMDELSGSFKLGYAGVEGLSLIHI